MTRTVRLEVAGLLGAGIAQFTVIQAPIEKESAEIHADIPREIEELKPSQRRSTKGIDSAPPAALEKILVTPFSPQPVSRPIFKETPAISIGSSPTPKFPSRDVLSSMPPASAIQFSAAIPTRKVSPKLPLTTRELVREDVTLEVQIKVDATTRVSDATVLKQNTFTERLLAPRAQQAAQMWQFEPAKMNGNPVPSEVILTFHFARSP